MNLASNYFFTTVRYELFSVSYVTIGTTCDALVFYIGAILRGARTENVISHGLVCRIGMT